MPKLTEVSQRFVRHWGEMGTRWGIARTVAQIHALLYIAPEPLNAEEIVEVLSVSRSNVSTSIKELQGWGIVRVVHQPGDRRDYFESLHDVWEMFRIILAERKRREIDPTVAMLRECLAEAEKSRAAADETARKRLRELLGFFEAWLPWYDDMHRLPKTALKVFVKLGGKLKKLLGATARDP